MRILFLSAFFLSLLSCESATHVDIDAVIEEKVQERLDEFERVIMKRCLDRALEEAGTIADSIIIEQARMQKDTSKRPPRPLRSGRLPRDVLSADGLFQEQSRMCRKSRLLVGLSQKCRMTENCCDHQQ